jgi:hypothetical protein
MDARRIGARRLLALCLLYMVAWTGCGDEAGAARVGVGTVDFYLAGNSDLVIGDVVYEISGNDIETILGTMQASDDNAPVSTAVTMPEGNGYLLRIKTHVIRRGDAGAGDTGSPATCLTSARFNVKEGRTTHLRVVFQCEELTDDFGFDSSVFLPGLPDDASVAEPDELPPFSLDAGTGENSKTELPQQDATSAALRPDASRGAYDDPIDGEGSPCEVCSIRECGETSALSRATDCYMASGTAIAGPAQGQSKGVLCAALVDCAHETGCASAHPEDCYCGIGMTGQSCRMSEPTGLCRAEYEAAAESTDSKEVLGSFGSPTLAVFAAGQLLQCEAKHCQTECFASP